MKLLHEKKTDIRLTYPSSVDFPPHLHDALELVFILRGTTTAICDRGRWVLTAGDVFVAFPNQVHGYENTAGFEGFLLIVPTKPHLSAYRAILEQRLPTNPVLHLGQPEYTQILTLLQLALSDRKIAPVPIMQGYSMVIVGKLLPLIKLTEIPAATDALQSVLYYISKHYTQPLSRADIARAVGYTESYISHIFTDSLNTTLTDYITRLRLDDALHLLTNTDLTVSHISMMLGFSSIRSFNRYFARVVKMSPTAYRQAANPPRKT